MTIYLGCVLLLMFRQGAVGQALRVSDDTPSMDESIANSVSLALNNFMQPNKLPLSSLVNC